MELPIQPETNPKDSVCPECGTEESGYFCRGCGKLLRDGGMVLCPRCHHVVPGGTFCNQCGQDLGGIALQLRQLAQAGDEFWLTAGTQEPDTAASSWLEQDGSAPLAKAEWPDWLKELAKSAPASNEARVYPSLRPLQERRPALTGQRGFLIVAILLVGVLLWSLVFVVFYLFLRGGV